MKWILPITLMVLMPFLVNCQTCEPGWQALQGRCFFAVSGGDLPTSFEARRLACLERRADLAKFDPPAQFQFFTFAEYYIGLTDRAMEGNFTWVRDNSIPSFIPWAAFEPNGGVSENCVVASAFISTWRDTSCNRPLPFICERPAENPPSCGTEPATSRIIGGNDAPEGTWPWYGSIRIFGSLPNCGVTLISEEWAITAAHCGEILVDQIAVFGQTAFANDPPSPYRQESEVTWFFHPFYNSSSFENDIALLYLHNPVTITNFVRPACVYDTTTSPAEDSSPPELTELTNCYIIGLGLTDYDTFETPETLQEAPVEIFPPSACANYSEEFFQRIMLCAGNTDFSVDTCSGDSGGGLICRRSGSGDWTLAGITSFGFGCAIEGFPGVYTRLATTNSFIENTRSASGLFRCPTSGKLILDNQACNMIVDCEDYADEIGCGNLQPGQVFDLSSPKFGIVTNFITRSWIFFPPTNRRLLVSVSTNNLVSDSGTLNYLRNINGASQETVPAVTPPLPPFAFTSEILGAPIVLSMEKRSMNSVAGFQATISVS